MPGWYGTLRQQLAQLLKKLLKSGHINCLELKAAKLGLLSLCEKEEHVLIHLQSDVTTVTFNNNNYGWYTFYDM